MKFLVRFVLFLMLVLAVGLVALFVGRNTVATRLARSALSERGVVCTPLVLSLDGLLSRAEVGNTSCALAEGDVERVGLSRGLHADLSWRGPTRIVIPSAELTRRRREDPPDIRGLLAGQVPERLRSLLLQLADLSRDENLPSVQIEGLRILGASKIVEIRGLNLDRKEDHLALSLASVAPPSRGTGPGPEPRAGLVNMRGRATSSEVTLSGHIDVGVEFGEVDLSRAVPVELIGRGLDGPSPRYEVRLEPSERLERLRALRQRAPSGLPRPEDIEQGVREVLERSRERREARRGRRKGPLSPLR